MQIGSKRCIFLHPTCGGVEENGEILLRGGLVSISLSMLWTCTSPLRFHQITEDSNCFSSENRHFDHNLSGPYTLIWKDNRECSDVSQYSDPPIARAGVCDKSKEVSDDPLREDRVSGIDNKLQRDDYLSSGRENPKTKITIFRFVSEPTSANFTTDEGVNNPGCPVSATNRFL